MTSKQAVVGFYSKPSSTPKHQGNGVVIGNSVGKIIPSSSFSIKLCRVVWRGNILGCPKTSERTLTVGLGTRYPRRRDLDQNKYTLSIVLKCLWPMRIYASSHSIVHRHLHPQPPPNHRRCLSTTSNTQTEHWVGLPNLRTFEEGTS